LGNRRRAALQLSPAGQRLHDELLPQVRQINTALVAPLDADALAQLDHSLHCLQQQANRAAQDEASGAAFPPRQSGHRQNHLG
jgi:hypothetical protein